MSVLRTKLGRDIRRQRAQFAAIAFTIFLGVTLFGASYDAYRNLDASYRQAFTEYRFANLTVSGGNIGRLAREAEETLGVEAVQTRVSADVPIRVGKTKFLGRVVGVPAGHQPAVNMVEVQRGRYPKAGSRNGVLIEEHMADHFDLGPGDRLRVAGASGPRAVHVRGVVASPEYFWPARSRQDLLPSPDDFGVVFAPQGLAEELGGLRGPNQVAIYYTGGGVSDPLTAKLTNLADEADASGVLTRADQPSNSALQEDVKAFRELALLFPLLFLTAAALATGILMRRLVTGQRPIVGMLRACGYSRRQVVGHYLSFGLAMGLAGGMLGAAAGVALAGLVTHAYTSALSIPVTLVEISPGTVLVGLAFGLGVGVLAAALPARAASRVAPAEAMRSVSPPRGGHLSLPERALPPLRRLPARWRMVVRSIGRNRRRSLSTVAGVVLALTLVLVSWGMVDTAQILVNRQFERVERQDAELHLRRALSAAELSRVRNTPGVERAEPGLNVPVSLAANERRYQTSLVGLEPDTRMHGFLLAGGGEASLPASGLLAGKALRSELGIGAGDEVSVSVPGTGLAARAPVEGFVDEPLGTYAYASLDAIRAVAGRRLGEGNVALVRYAAGVDRDRMRRRLSTLPGVVAFEDSNALRDTVNDYLALYYAFVGVMLLFGGAMAFALLYNGIQSNLAERSVEVATLRAAGIPFGTLSRMITGENILLTALGIVPGLVVGYEVARLFMASFSSDQFSFDLQMRTSTLILSSLAMVAVALLSQIPGLRAVKRLDIAAVVRERSA